MPEGGFDAVVFDVVIAHFTPAPMCELLERLMQVGGVSGPTIVERKDGPKSPHTMSMSFATRCTSCGS